MSVAIRRANVAGAPYLEESEAAREERKVQRRVTFINVSRQTILFALALAAAVTLKISLGF